tara:strand:+ start:432 stop:692 length:261 start_codon:yes stop_codon:yes gene_type:complete
MIEEGGRTMHRVHVNVVFMMLVITKQCNCYCFETETVVATVATEATVVTEATEATEATAVVTTTTIIVIVQKSRGRRHLFHYCYHR